MEDVLAIRDEYRLQEWSQIIQAGQNSGLSKRSLTGRLRLSLSSEQDARARILLLLKEKMQRRIVTGCCGPIIWIGILIRQPTAGVWCENEIKIFLILGA